MKFTYVTLFKDLISFYFEDSILKIAKENGLFQTEFYNPRDFSKNKHKKVDDYKQGGGAGMIMTPQPLFDVLEKIKAEDPNARIIFPIPAGKPFHQKDAVRLAKEEHIVFVSGRYEGIDERVIETFADEVFSIGDYVLTGGELPSLVMTDSILRNVDGVLGNQESLAEESFNAVSSLDNTLLEAPSFAKPYNFRDILSVSENLKGNHDNIRSQNLKMARQKTKYFRPSLIR